MQIIIAAVFLLFLFSQIVLLFQGLNIIFNVALALLKVSPHFLCTSVFKSVSAHVGSPKCKSKHMQAGLQQEAFVYICPLLVVKSQTASGREEVAYTSCGLSIESKWLVLRQQSQSLCP